MTETYTKWHIPDVGSTEAEPTSSALHIHRQKKQVIADDAEETSSPQPLTAHEIDAIRQAAIEDGYAEGLAKGIAEGNAQGYQEGYAKGEQEGHLAGLKEGEKEGLEHAKSKAQIFEMIANRLFEPLSQIDDKVEQQLVMLAVELAGAVLQAEVASQSKHVLTALKNGIAVLPVTDETITIKCHPDDIEVINAHFTETQRQNPLWQIHADAAITRGGCELLTQHNAVDMTIQRRYRQVIEKFMLEQGLPYDSIPGR